MNYEKYCAHEHAAKKTEEIQCNCPQCQQYRRVFADQLEGNRQWFEDFDPRRK